MVKKILLISIVICSVLVYGVFDKGTLFNQNTVNTVENTEVKKNNIASESNFNVMQVRHSSNILGESGAVLCRSPIYVSDVMSNHTQYGNQSLINLLKYFKGEGYKNDDIRNILIDSKLYKRTEVENAAILYEPPIYMSEKVNKTQLLYNYKQIDKFHGDYQSLAEAVKHGEIDPIMDLSIFSGHPKSLIEFILEKKGTLPDISVFQSLLNSGVPVRPNTILNALRPNVNTDILLLMIKYLPDSDRNHHWDEFFNGGFNYSYTSFSAKHSTLESLKIILSESLGNKSDAINILLKDKIEYDQRTKPIDIFQLAERNNNFNKKLDMLLEYDIPVDSELLSSYLRGKGTLTEEQQILLTQKTQSIDQKKSNSVDGNLRKSVMIYAKQLQAANKAWPEFIFSYDPGCKRIPANSHYRFNNLLENKVLIDLLANNKTIEPQSIIEQIQQKGDIYVDWYIKNYILPKMTREPRVKVDKSNKKLRIIAASVRGNIALGKWSEIEDALSSNRIPVDYVYRNNTYLVEAGIEERVPQNELFDWISLGVPVHNTTLDHLLSIEEYAEFTFELLKSKKLINKSLKSVLFQAARYNNIQLIKLLLKKELKTEPFNNNVGLTALNWTLLNYNRDMKSQLDMLLDKENQLSSEQKELLITVKL